MKTKTTGRPKHEILRWVKMDQHCVRGGEGKMKAKNTGRPKP